MSPKMRTLLCFVLAAVCVFGTVMLVRSLTDRQKALEDQQQALDLVLSTVPAPPPTTLPAQTVPAVPEITASTEPPETRPAPIPPDDTVLWLQKMDIAALQTRNPDVIGWIHLDGTDLSYPLLQGQDNETYLHTAWDGAPNTGGSIFMETYNEPEFTDFNTILYGHNMQGGHMFGLLHRYRDREFQISHPNIYIVTPAKVLRYAIFAAYQAPTNSSTYRLSFSDDSQKEAALADYLAASVWDSGILPDADNGILTLSTCTGTGTYEKRWVVQGVCTGQWQ